MEDKIEDLDIEIEQQDNEIDFSENKINCQILKLLRR